ncbi:hypothetical protein BCR34DRAFT_42549 [Clohesyomyces aquaticus]|uniref:Uncharacterized protein n=1 Tax=Clohesyomyces aquaticus TaxID=1231657 RepID=A0A1Y1Z6Q5_9PLEO|nr:hypothetical protein BCR34DRAFT_42549 [Clohesyomyces aquaticus]
MSSWISSHIQFMWTWPRDFSFASVEPCVLFAFLNLLAPPSFAVRTSPPPIECEYALLGSFVSGSSSPRPMDGEHSLVHYIFIIAEVLSYVSLFVS